MEPIIVENNVVNISEFDKSIVEIEKFIEAQRNALYIINHDNKSLEELKRQAVAQPSIVLRDIIAGEHNFLKITNAPLGLDVNLPEIDWTLLEACDLNPVTHTRASETSPSRVDKMRKHISHFHQALTQLTPLPPELLDKDGRDAEERRKKRRRVESAPRIPVTSSSSGLRLPQLPNPYDNFGPQPSFTTRIPQFPEPGQPSTLSSGSAKGQPPTKPVDIAPQPYTDDSYSQRRTWASKGLSDDASLRHTSPTPASPTSQDTPATPTPPAENSPVTFTREETMAELPDAGEAHSTFKQNWTLAEQHTLERLLVEIPSTVKFRWVRISEAMGGTRTPRQVASRVQKYYEKMKKLGVSVNSADMGGGGRGGSKATQVLDAPPSMRTRGPSTRGKPKTGPQYTKSGRRR
ncbi:hypothetical protein OPQ81_003509 [Rhizoctonia solani]|nr:hypothetical protein OPQ81_003509 [Rhizoctonia solani]